MLVDPVADDRAGDPPTPPRLFAHLQEPRDGGVPVVVDVVVVEDHCGGHRREQPADRLLPPGLPVEAGVLLEIRDLLAGLASRSAALTDEFPRLWGVLI